MSDIMERIRALIMQAEDERTPPHEAAAMQERASAMMFRYQIDRAMLNEAKPASERDKPCRINIDIGNSGDPILVHFSSLGNAVAEHTRCRVIWLRGSEEYHQRDRLAVYGYKEDVEYFEILYTLVFMHMSKIFFPKPDPEKTLDQNVIQLRKLGMNWLQMAEVYGWYKVDKSQYQFDMDPAKEWWRHKITGERKTNFQIGGYFKRVTHRAFEKAGLSLEIISSVDSRRAEGLAYRDSVASGYVGRVTERLRHARGANEATVGAELVLLSASRAIDDMISRDWPNLETIKRDRIGFNPDAYARGIRFGSEADLNTGARMGTGSKGELGGQ